MADIAMKRIYGTTGESDTPSTGFRVVGLNWGAQRETTDSKKSAREEITSPYSAQLPSKTEAEERDFFELSLVSGLIQEDKPDLPNGALQDVALAKEIKGVVSKITDECVFINCQLPEDTIELSFPRGIVPEALSKYGAPVSVALERVEGFKQPIIKSRTVEENPHFKEELKKLGEWAEQL